MAELEGATKRPGPGLQIITAGEFAAMWNAQTPEQRQQLLDGMLDSAGRASRCIMQDHEAAMWRANQAERNYWVLHDMATMTATEADRAIIRHGWVIEP